MHRASVKHLINYLKLFKDIQPIMKFHPDAIFVPTILQWIARHTRDHTVSI